MHEVVELEFKRLFAGLWDGEFATSKGEIYQVTDLLHQQEDNPSLKNLAD
jgi:hypothetical protein